MRKIIVKIFSLSIVVILLSINSSTSLEQEAKVQKNLSPIGTQDTFQMLEIKPDFGKIPLYFIPNKGQVHEKALFYAKTSRYTLWMTSDGLVFDSSRKLERNTNRQEDKEGLNDWKTQLKDALPETYERDVSRLIFQNAKKNPEIVPLGLTEHRVNYFIGNDKDKWKTDISTSKNVLYKDLYKNIDLKVYGVEKQIEYDWIVKPGGKPEEIIFTYKDTNGTEINNEGDLLVLTEFGELIHKRPVSYQVVGGERVNVKSSFKRIGEDTYGFEVKSFDKNYELVIDPVVLAYSTYLGGSDNDRGYSIAVDSSGHAYVTGYTDSTNFPKQNPYQTIQGSKDVFVTKLSPSGNSLVYSTYLGGGGDDFGYSIAVDSSGNAYVTGYTKSTDFPTQNPYQTDQFAHDVFVTKLSPAGSSLVYSTYLSGNSLDCGYGIAVDSSGNAYVTGETTSTDFPTQNPYQTAQADRDVFVTKLSPTGNSLVYSTYLGGGGWDHGQSIAVDSFGYAYVTGPTASTDFPTQNPYQNHQGGWDVFVTKLSLTGSSLIYSTYFGGIGADYGQSIAVDDSSGNAYVTGYTYSSDFPTQNPYQTDQDGALGDVFVTKLSPAGNSLVYSTYLGGSGGDRGRGIAVDSSGNAYVTGDTESTDFPTQYPYQTRQGGVDDVFVTKLSSSGSSLVYSTYLGGSTYMDAEFGYGIAVDSSENVYVTGYTYGSDFPTQNPYQTHQGNQDAYVSKLSYYSDEDPTIISISPDSGFVGTQVTISGFNFSEALGTVSFNGVNAPITSWTDTQIITTVPVYATSGYVWIKTAAGKNSNSKYFAVFQNNTLSGIIRDAETLTPISGAEVKVGEFETTSASSGYYYLTVPYSGDIIVRVIKENYYAQSAIIKDFMGAIQKDFNLVSLTTYYSSLKIPITSVEVIPENGSGNIVAAEPATVRFEIENIGTDTWVGKELIIRIITWDQRGEGNDSPILFIRNKNYRIISDYAFSRNLEGENIGPGESFPIEPEEGIRFLNADYTEYLGIYVYAKDGTIDDKNGKDIDSQKSFSIERNPDAIKNCVFNILSAAFGAIGVDKLLEMELAVAKIATTNPKDVFQSIDASLNKNPPEIGRAVSDLFIYIWNYAELLGAGLPVVTIIGWIIDETEGVGCGTVLGEVLIDTFNWCISAFESIFNISYFSSINLLSENEKENIISFSVKGEMDSVVDDGSNNIVTFNADGERIIGIADSMVYVLDDIRVFMITPKDGIIYTLSGEAKSTATYTINLYKDGQKISFSDLALNAGAKIELQVSKATIMFLLKIDDNGDNIFDREIYPTSTITLPEPPSNVQATLSNSIISVSWDQSVSSGVRGYKVWIGNENQEYVRVYDANNNLNYSITKEVDSSYYVSVAAYSDYGEGNKSPGVLIRNIPPKVEIKSPEDAEMVSGIVNINVTASDSDGINKVEFYVDDTKLGEDTLSPYNYVWNTKTYSNGSHIIKAKAYDKVNQSLEDQITVIVINIKEDLLGTWTGQGVYYRNSDTGSWVKLGSPATKITAGDLDNDGTDDLLGIWPAQGGVWVKYSGSGSWALLSSTADWIGAGDMNGDGRDDLLGTWTGQGVFYKDSVSGTWIKMATPATKTTSGDLDNDGTDDIIGIWPAQGGVWVKYSSSGNWAKLSSTADWIGAGDMNGDGRCDLLGTWTDQGVYYKDSDTGSWVKMATSASQIAVGDIDGDGTDDLLGIWPAQGGVWVKYSSNGTWERLSSTADWIAAGRMRGAGGGGIEMFQDLLAPIGGYAEGPGSIDNYVDLSSEGPGGWNFVFQEEENLIPQERESIKIMKTPGPGDPGFNCVEQKNLVPQEEVMRKRGKKKEK